jgi:iron complex outermembrane receptor protein
MIARQNRTLIAGLLVASGVLLSFKVTPLARAEAFEAVPPSELKKLPIESLYDLEVWSASKKEEKLSYVPAAMHVITQEDIRRSGVTSIPEALRLAEGLDVARIDSHTWAVSARGFNSTTANKLQVLMDGRVLYTPLYSGVFWDVQDTLLEDIDRIEVIRGPGATVWGANAVNGVINIITKPAKQTQGWFVEGGGGTEERGFGAAQYGGKLADKVYYRVYGKYFNRDDSVFPNGDPAGDAWQMGRGGAALEWDPTERDNLTLRTAGYVGDERQSFTNNHVNGSYALGRWTRSLYEGSSVQVETYYDRTFRDVPLSFKETRDTYDVDFQHRFPLWERQDVVWGAAYFLTADRVGNGALISWDPSHRASQLYSGFIQDEIALVRERLALTLGSKFEHNDYSGFEIQPSIRLAWTPTTNQTIWGAISRAVRSPARLESDIRIQAGPISLLGNPDFESEKVTAFEVGYRLQPHRQISIDIATFYNLYDDLRSIDGFFPGQTLVLANDLKGESRGVELGLNYQMLDWWRWNAGYTFLDEHIHRKAGTPDPMLGPPEFNDPSHQFFLRSYMDLPQNFEFDWDVRYVHELPAPHVPSYIVGDARLGWRPTQNWEVSIVGQNLFQGQHIEFASGSALPREIEQSVYGKITWRY